MHFHSLEDLKTQQESMGALSGMDSWDKFKFISSYITLGAGFMASIYFLSNYDTNRLYFIALIMGSYLGAAIVYGALSLIQYLYEIIF